MVTRLWWATALMLLLLQGFAHAEGLTPDKTFSYDGQTVEDFDLENLLKETRYRAEEVPHTCTRQVPYTENVCRNVTLYRQECRTVPGHQECRTVYDPVCRDETRYRQECTSGPSRQECRTETRYRQECTQGPSRQECSQGPSRQECRNVTRTRRECSSSGGGQVCRTEPGRQQCRVVNGQNVCRDIPPRQICENKPPVQTCRDVPYTDRECTTVPGQQVCRTVPGQQICRQVPYSDRVCHTVPGEPICRQVPYNDRVCQNVPRQQCDWVPDRNVCEQIPYTERVCADETRYRDEQYACTRTIQVPYEVTVKTFKAQVHFDFANHANAALAAVFSVKLSDKGELAVKASDSRALIFAKKTVQREDAGDEVAIRGEYKIDLYDYASLTRAYEGIKDLALQKKAVDFWLAAPVQAERLGLKLRIAKGNKVSIDRELKGGEFTLTANQLGGTNIHVDLAALGVKKLSGFGKHEVTVVAWARLEDMGEILFPLNPVLRTQTTQELKAE